MAIISYSMELKDKSHLSKKTDINKKIFKASIHNLLAGLSLDSEKKLRTSVLAETTTITQLANGYVDNIQNSAVLCYIDDYLNNVNRRIIDGVNIKNNVVACLAISEYDEPTLNTISLNSQGHFESKKFYNIKFNLKKFVSTLANFGLTVEAAVSGNIPVMIITGIASVVNLFDAVTIEFDDLCGKILQKIYLESDNGFIKQEDLIKILKASDKDLTDSKIQIAINQLIKYRCITVNRQFISLCEIINYPNNY